MTNIIPGSGFIRDTYSHTDNWDYNNALRGVDNAAIALGTGMINAGGTGTVVGSTLAVAGVSVTVGSGGVAAVAGAPAAILGGTLAGASAATLGSGMVLMSSGNQNKDAGYERGKGATSKTKGLNQLKQEVKAGQAPKGIKRFDSPHDIKTGQEHVHFSNGRALNKDGSWKDGEAFELSNKLKKYLNENGWKVE